MDRKTFLLRFWLVLLFVGFVTNWVWEMAHMRAYRELAQKAWQETLLPCTRAAIADALITLGIFGILLLLRRLPLRLPLLPAGAILGAVTAIGIEKIHLARGSWSYSEAMPIVPFIEVGLWPLLQLTLLVPAAIGSARWSTRHRKLAVD